MSEREAELLAALRDARQALYDIGWATSMDQRISLETWRTICEKATGQMMEIDAVIGRMAHD